MQKLKINTIISIILCHGCTASNAIDFISENDAGLYDSPVDSAANTPTLATGNNSVVLNMDGELDAGNSNSIDASYDAGYDPGLNTVPEVVIPKKSDINGHCDVNADCVSNICNYNHICIEEPSCVNYLGGNSCGYGEVGDPNAKHESCCKSLPVAGFNDPIHPGKTIFLDKYEITSGRIRAFINHLNSTYGKPNVKSWVENNVPNVWNNDWNKFLPSDYDNGLIQINRLLLGDPRHDGEVNPGPGVIVPPATDQIVSVGLNRQFGAQIYADLHGNNCGTFAGSYGFPTYYYPDNVYIANGEKPRSNALDMNGKNIVAQDWLDVKPMNCITNAMLQAFCYWDTGGKGSLATSEVMEYITNTPVSLGNTSGCGSQYDNHDKLLGNIFTGTIQTGGKCADVKSIIATFDAGDYLPVSGSVLNNHIYHYPDIGDSTSDKAWQISAPGRVKNDVVHLIPGDEGWYDLAGNLNETVLETVNGVFSGKFGIRFRGIGYGSSRSDLNVKLIGNEIIVRVARPEAKSALVGARCLRYKN